MIKFPKKTTIIAGSLIVTGLLTASLIKASESKDSSEYSAKDSHKAVKTLHIEDEWRARTESHPGSYLEGREPRNVVININIYLASGEDKTEIADNRPI